MTTSHVILSLAAVTVLVAVHLTAGYFDRWQGRGREIFLGAAGGVTVAYVVMQLLPSLSLSDQTIGSVARQFLPLFERHGYFLAVIGIVVFYANANYIARSRARQRSSGRADRADRRAFITSMILMGAFNFMVAYSIADPNTPDVQPVVLFVLTLALFYFVADEFLHSNYEADYRRAGRWILSAALGVGWLLGLFLDIPAAALALVVAFFSGGILVTVLGHQLQPGATHKVWAFATGAVLFSVLLMALQSV